MKTLIGSLSVLLAIAVASKTAAAQPGVSPPGASPAPLPAPPTNEQFEPYSPTAALAWSALTTAAGYGAVMIAADQDSDLVSGLAAAAIMVGPNAGDIYAGDSGRAILHTGIRGGALLLIIAGAVQSFDDCFDDDNCGNDGEALIWGGVAIFVGDTIYSIATASSTARKQNEKMRRRLMITPTPIVAPNRPTGYGLSLTGDF